MNDSVLWRHYFFDLPLYALGFRSKRLGQWDTLSGERRHVLRGIEYLNQRPRLNFTNLAPEAIAKLHQHVRLQRESDTYTAVWLTRRNLSAWCRIQGLEHLDRARYDGVPVVLIGGHLGSNYLMWIALGLRGHHVYPVARAVDRSPATPRPRQAYMALTYRLTQMKWAGHYLLADSQGHFPPGRFPRILDDVFRRCGICFAAIDFPSTLYCGRQQPVAFLGESTLLPVGFIQLALQKKARILTVWDRIEFREGRTLRCIELGPPIGTQDPAQTLQVYADRLTELICREPWQWMGLSIAEQYHRAA